MNPRLDALQPYPFERLNALKAGLTPNTEHPPVALSIGEPQHPPPDFIVDSFADRERLRQDLKAYPATKGTAALRSAISDWLRRRFSVSVDPENQILPVAGTREALFSFPQAILSGRTGSVAVVPNPFYQIYEGAALLGGATPYFVNCTPQGDYLPDFAAIPESVWRRCELVFVCSPGNPTGRVLGLDQLVSLLELAERHDFIVAADECYSEIYPDESAPPPGLLQAAVRRGDDRFRRCMVFHSLSKRSNLPGLRSGFVAGDAALIERYLLYRTYHGCALGLHTTHASILAWSDEDHVVSNRAAYREKFRQVLPILRGALPDYPAPEGAFYCWLPTPTNDVEFTARLFAEQHITVLPGSFLGRPTPQGNPGAGFVRVAWVAPLEQCLDAARRLVPYLG